MPTQIQTGDIADGAVTGVKIASSVALSGSPTTTTQSPADNSTKIATTAYADAAAAAAGGAVDSVNGQTGVVVLNASDVGADPSGSAATVASNLSAHIADATDAHAASAISFSPTGTIAATDVQAAIAEVAIEAGTIAAVKKRLGLVIDVTPDASSGSLYTDTTPNTTVTFTSGGITVSGGNNDALNWLEYTSYNTSVHYWTRKIRFVPTADGNGIGLGINSANGKQLGRIICTGANKGKVLIDTYRSGTLTNRVTSTPALTYTNTTDTIELTLTKSMTTYRITAQVVGTPASVVSAEWVDTLASGGVSSVWAVGKSAIYHFGGDQTIKTDKYTVDEFVQNEIAIISDSIGAGSYAGTLDAMYSQILDKWINRGVTLLAGGGNQTTDYAAIKNEFIALKPKIAIHTLGINDIINAISSATTQANILTFIQDCYSNNITPILCEVMHNGAGNATAVNALNAWMNGLGYVKVVPMNAAMTASSALVPLYDSGDGTHPNAVGNKQYATTIVTAIKNLVNVAQAYNPSTVNAQGFNDSVNYNSGINFIYGNASSGTSSTSSIRIAAGTVTGFWTTYSDGYTATAGYQSKTLIQNNAAGMGIVASGASGTIEFLTGGAVLASNLKMTISTTAISMVLPVTNTQAVAGTFSGFTAVNSTTTALSTTRIVASCSVSVYIQATGTGFTPTGGILANDGLFISQGVRHIVGCTNASGTIEFGVGASLTVGGFMTSSGLWRFGDNTTPTAVVDISAGTTGRASIRIRSGVAPTTPNDGDIWYDGTDLKMRVGGTTKTFTIV